MEIDNFRHLAFPSGAVAVANTDWIAFLFTSKNTGQNMSLFIKLVYNGEMKANRNGASQPSGG